MILTIYLILASTVGAYYFAKVQAEQVGTDVTLLGILGSIFPAILLSPVYLLLLLSLVVVKKHK